MHRKEDIIHSITTGIAFAFFLLIFSSLSGRTVRQNKISSRFELQQQFNSNQEMAVIADAVQLPTFQKSCVLLPDNLADRNRNSVVDNKKITQYIFIFQKIHLLIKPVTYCRFYYHLFPKDADDLPTLS
jgi:hypothetical protein